MKRNALLIIGIILNLFVFIGNAANPDTGSSTITDIDGNVYHTVTIGSQTWTVENLRTTRFNNGKPIPIVTDSFLWGKLKSPAYCYYNNTANRDSINKFGALYNWCAVNTGKLAPKGWHVPTYAETYVLENYLITHGNNFDGTTSGNKIAKAIAAKTDWESSFSLLPEKDSTVSTGTGTIGNDLSKNNKSGFSALPGGVRGCDGNFHEGGENGYLWSVTDEDSSSAYGRGLSYIDYEFMRDVYGKFCGFSVRLLKGEYKSKETLKNPKGHIKTLESVGGMRHIPGGTFRIVEAEIIRHILGGAPSCDTDDIVYGVQPDPCDISTPHTVTISSFFMDTTVVTQGDYLTLTGVNPSQFTGDLQRPVENITWFDAVLYCNVRSKHEGKDTVYSYSTKIADSICCKKLKNIVIDYSKNGYRLPTEAEWEFACRVGTRTSYVWGDTLDEGYCWSFANSKGTTHPVAMKRPNAWGLYDMIGNVLQWCNDWYGNYESSSQIYSTGENTGRDRRVARGNAWSCELVNILPSALRTELFPGERYSSVGFRCVRR